MIGVLAEPGQHQAVQEFFELFKTPWEHYRQGRRYDVLVCSGGAGFVPDAADLVLIYSGRSLPDDAESPLNSRQDRRSGRTLRYRHASLPVYGGCVTFDAAAGELVDQQSGEPAMYKVRTGRTSVVRVGYDLFDEIAVLLTAGQPAACAHIPAVELHIALLRDVILENGHRLIEIPPVPCGYRFGVCLTHDVDHPLLRSHKLDHTLLGFIYRACAGSVLRYLRGRMSAGDLVRNWLAVVRLPFVRMGLAEDPWYGFDRYVKLEGEARSSFFVIPFKNASGLPCRGGHSYRRAAAYGPQDIADRIRQLRSQGCEIGVHGIDAWIDSASGRRELEAIRDISRQSEAGVRMHWLYFDENSPAALEEAGYSYDSTVGYNETVGYRAGTIQAYRPLGANRLLELPLHVMDTAMFFPRYLDLSPEQARSVVGRLIDSAMEYGGCLTLNWHDRSLAPERLWGDCYAHLLEDIKSREGWLCTAAQAVAWFRRRRSVVFDALPGRPAIVRARVTAADSAALPDLLLQIHSAVGSHQDIPLAAATADKVEHATV